MRECETQGRGVGFSFRSVFATDAGGKIISQPEFPELLADSRTVSAGDDSRARIRARASESLLLRPASGADSPAGKRASKAGLLRPISRAAGEPRDRRDTNPANSGARDRRVPNRCRGPETSRGRRENPRRRNLRGCRPSQTERREQRIACVSLRNRIRDSGLCRAVAHRENIVAANREVVEARCVAAPAGHIRILGAHDVSRGAHLDRTLAKRPFDERHFELDRGTRFERRKARENRRRSS